MKVFYLQRDFYSNPQIILIVAPDLKTAKEMLREQLKTENFKPSDFDKLTELDLKEKSLEIFSPPGDRHFIR